MRCEYCDVEVVTYPADGLCACCGAVLPPRPAAAPSAASTPSAPAASFVSDLRCPKCRSTGVTFQKRGFSWLLAVLGFLLFPVFGLLLGFVGSRKLRCRCPVCGHKWTRA